MTSASPRKPMRTGIALSLVFLSFGIALSVSPAVCAQEPLASSATPVVPQRVRYTGKLAARAGEAVEAVFRIYAAQQGGEPLWTETQRVTIAEDGSYTVLLGSAGPDELPQAVFAGGAARWLGVTVERGEEQERVLLSSVPYAMKSADAESLAGHPVAEFVTQAQLAGLTEQLTQTASKVEQAAASFHPEVSPSPTGAGTTNTVPLWTSSSTLGNSSITQSGSKIGINFAAPTATLEVGGAMTVHGTLAFPPGQPATSTSSSQSQSFTFSASAWNSTTAAPVSSTYTMLAGPTGNNTASPNSIFYLNYQNGTNPAISEFTLNGKGVLQLPNATGGLLSNGNVSLAPAAIATSTTATNSPLLQIGASSFDSASNIAHAQTFALQAQGLSNDTATPTGSLQLLYGSNGATPAATGLSIAPNGQITFAPGQTFPGAGGGSGTITGITTTSPLTGSGTTGSVALRLNTSALETTLNTVYPQLGTSNQFTGSISANVATGSPSAAIEGYGSSGSIGIWGQSDYGFGIFGISNSNTGIYGTSASSTEPAIEGFSTGTGTGGSFFNSATANAALYAENDATGNPGLGIAVKGYTPNAYSIGVLGKSLANNSYGVFGENTGGQDSYGVYATTTGAGSDAIYAKSTGGADSNNVVGSAVVGISTSGSGVVGSSNGLSKTGNIVGANSGAWGVWGDTGSITTGAGILGTADDNYAAFFSSNGTDTPTINVSNMGQGIAAQLNNQSSVTPTLYAVNNGGYHAADIENDSSTSPTLYLYNSVGGPTTNAAPFKTLMASTPTGVCGFGGNGDLSCTGQVKALVTTSGGARRVETYAPQSAENWMEDYGSGNLEKGVAVIKLDPAFIETVSETPDYHVFLTPNGDSKGLYVIKKTMTSFEVRESGGGVSSLTFDYKIVARRRGYETQRLVDVTDRFNAEVAAAKSPRPTLPKPSSLHKTVIERPAPPATSDNSAEAHRPALKPITPTAHRD